MVGSMNQSGVLVTPADYPGAIVFVLLIIIVLWMRRFGITVENEKTPKSMQHSRYVYALVILAVISIFWLRLTFPESMK
jgi:hypothetical protein